MAFQLENWLEELIHRLTAAFGKRLQAVGLQGSFARKEETPSSDIDAVVLLDQITPADIAAYKTVLTQLPPSSHPLCGFFGGIDDLKNWSRAELFQFIQDTRWAYGSPQTVLPKPTRRDAVSAAKTGAGNIYHALVHTWIHGELTPALMQSLCKSAFFMLQAAHFARTGRYIAGKQPLQQALTAPDEKRILFYTIHPVPAAQVQTIAQDLLAVSQRILAIK